MQARAANTRRAILDAAVGLFHTDGYASVSLADLITATGFSKGAFYYHFENREAVTAAIIAEADEVLRTATLQILADPSFRALGNLIRAVFMIADVTGENDLVHVGFQLRGGVGQLSTALDGFAAHRDLFTNAVAAAVADGDVRSDLDIDQVGHTLWTAVLGTQQHCDATGENVYVRLADVLTVLLPAICPAAAARQYGDLVEQLAGRERLADLG